MPAEIGSMRPCARHAGIYVASIWLISRKHACDSGRNGASLENYASLLRATGRSADAVYFKVRAKVIRAKHVEATPVQ